MTRAKVGYSPTKWRVAIPCPSCHGLAFLYEKYPKAGEVLESKYARDMDGNRPPAHSPMRCGSCGEIFSQPPRVEDAVPCQ